MVESNSIERTLRLVVDLLVKKNYAGLERLTQGVRLRSSEIEGAVRDYARSIAPPPPEAFSRADVIPIRGAAPPAYSVRFRLFAVEEGPSGLELQPSSMNPMTR